MLKEIAVKELLSPVGGDLLLKKVVWARRWERQEGGKYADSQLAVTDDEIETTDWSADTEGEG